MSKHKDLLLLCRSLADEVKALSFGPPVSVVYNPLIYAWELFEQYVRKFAPLGAKTLLVGMNPGPWGMVQTGVPFGDPSMVRDWLGLAGTVATPERVHPRRIVAGLTSQRREVSGTRLWGWARDRYVDPEVFFLKFFVWNHIPLCFLEDSGRNRTPDMLPRHERDALNEICDRALRGVVDILAPSRVIGIGGFAHGRVRKALYGTSVLTGQILHPSPANPAANKGWAAKIEEELANLGAIP